MSPQPMPSSHSILPIASTLCTLAVRRPSTIPATVAYWADVGWYLLLIGTSKGTKQHLFLLLLSLPSRSVLSVRLYFRIACHTRGDRAFKALASPSAPDEPGFELTAFSLRPTVTAVSCYMIACWGGAETMFRRRLALLKMSVCWRTHASGWNRTFGAPWSGCGLSMRRYVYARHGLNRPLAGTLYVGSPHNPGRQAGQKALTEEVAHLLLAMPATQAQSLEWFPGSGGWGLSGVPRLRYRDRERLPEPLQESMNSLPAEAYITVPVRLSWGKRWTALFDRACRYPFEGRYGFFSSKWLEHTMPTIDNIRLVDRLGSDRCRKRSGDVLHATCTIV